MTARSENLQGEQIVLTDAAGAFTLPQLPPGRYTLVFELDHHKPAAQPDLVVHAGGTVWFSQDLLSENVAVCFGPMFRRRRAVDVRSNALQFPVSREARRLVPLFAP